jgi:hypothetical protein
MFQKLNEWCRVYDLQNNLQCIDATPHINYHGDTQRVRAMCYNDEPKPLFLPPYGSRALFPAWAIKNPTTITVAGLIYWRCRRSSGISVKRRHYWLDLFQVITTFLRSVQGRIFHRDNWQLIIGH